MEGWDHESKKPETHEFMKCTHMQGYPDYLSYKEKWNKMSRIQR